MKKRSINFKFIIRRFLVKSLVDDAVPAYAGQICYFMIMSAIPFAILLGSFLRLTPLSSNILVSAIQSLLPGELSEDIVKIIDSFFDKPVAIVSVSAILAFWAASKGIHCMVNALNKINDLVETRNWFIVRLKSMFFVLLFIVLTILMLFLVMYSGALGDIIHNTYGDGPLYHFYNGIVNARFWIIFLILVIFFTIMYRFFPNRTGNASFWYQLPGAVFSALAWYVFTVFYAIFVNYLNGLEIYGTLASLIAVMFWFYICISIFLFCGEINFLFEREYRMLYDVMRRSRFFDWIYRRSGRIAKWMDKIRFFDADPEIEEERTSLKKVINSEEIFNTASLMTDAVNERLKEEAGENGGEAPAKLEEMPKKAAAQHDAQDIKIKDRRDLLSKKL